MDGHPLGYAELSRRVDHDVADGDRLYAAYRQFGTDEYFKSGWRQLDAITRLWTRHTGRPFGAPLTIVDYACHFGRLLRWLRAALPEATLIACDVDDEALAFCADRFKCQPLRTDWEPAQVPVAAVHDLVLCLSLVTHTDLTFARGLFGLWRRMLRPGGMLLVTFLGAGFIETWRSGALDHYAPIESADREAAIAAFRRERHAFAGFASGYSAEARYGIGFVHETLMREAIEAQDGLHVVELISRENNVFGQDLAVVLRFD